jgi:oxalate decarboxylase
MKFPFALAHTRIEEGGWTREITQRELPIGTTLAGGDMTLNPGAYRELHWHKQSEWAYVLEESCRIGLVDQDGRNFLDDVEKGDLWFFPKGVPHYIQALDEGVEFLLVFDDGAFSENSTFMLSDFFAHTPRSVLAKNFGWTPAQMAAMPEKEKYIFNGEVPPARRRPRSRPPWWSSNRARCVSCTGIRPMTSGSTTSPGSAGWGCSPVRGWPERTSRRRSGWPTPRRRSAPTRSTCHAG